MAKGSLARRWPASISHLHGTSTFESLRERARRTAMNQLAPAGLCVRVHLLTVLLVRARARLPRPRSLASDADFRSRPVRVNKFALKARPAFRAPVWLARELKFTLTTLLSAAGETNSNSPPLVSHLSYLLCGLAAPLANA